MFCLGGRFSLNSGHGKGDMSEMKVPHAEKKGTAIDLQDSGML